MACDGVRQGAIPCRMRKLFAFFEDGEHLADELILKKRTQRHKNSTEFNQGLDGVLVLRASVCALRLNQCLHAQAIHPFR